MLNNEKTDKVDMVTLDVPLFIRMLEYAKEDAKTDMDLHSVTEKIIELSKKGNLTMTNYNSIVRQKKEETNEMDSGSSGSSEGPAFGKTILKKDLYKTKEQDIDEITDAGVSAGAMYDAPFGSGSKKNPLAIGGEASIGQSRAIKDKNFPKYGGPDGKFVTINPKCKRFPYCNQGQKDAIKIFDEQLSEAIIIAAKKYDVPVKEIENIVINEIKQIFI